MSEILPKSFGTHDGIFHSDEVTACALLLLLDRIDIDRIFRTRDPLVLAKCEYVCDVGGFYAPEKKQFDHHQKEYSGPLSSAGMVLDYIKTNKLLPQKECELLHNSLVRGVDAHDNGKDPEVPGYCFFSHIISNMAPIEYTADPSDYHKTFIEAVLFTHGHISRMLKRYRYNHSTRKQVESAMETTLPYLLFENQIPWMDCFFELSGEKHTAVFVIMPAGPYWKLRGIPPSLEEKMKVRFPLPSSWAGLMDTQLQEVSGIPDAVFCHKGRFISVWKTKEAAIQAARKTLGYTNN